jgi:hypothetical protein
MSLRVVLLVSGEAERLTADRAMQRVTVQVGGTCCTRYILLVTCLLSSSVEYGCS